MPYAFVRALPNGESEWLDYNESAEAGGDRVTLTPQQVMALGLGDKLRIGIQDGPSPDVRPVEPEAPEVPYAEPRRKGDLRVLGGYTDAWRWQAVEDGDELLWAIDNRPALEAWRQTDQLEPAPPYHHLVVPDDVLRTIVSSG